MERQKSGVTLGLVITAVFAVPLSDALVLIVDFLVFGAPRTYLITLVVVTGVYLPLHLYHLASALRGRRARFASWTLTVMAVVVLGQLVVRPVSWTVALAALGASTLVVVRRPWGWACLAAVAAVTPPLMLANGLDLYDAVNAPLWVVARSVAVFVLVATANTLRQLNQARGALTVAAVDRERLRISDDLRRSVEAALVELVAQGRRVETLLDGGHRDQVRVELAQLLDRSRATSAQAREVVRARPPAAG